MANSKLKKFARDHWGKAATLGNAAFWAPDIMELAKFFYKDGGRVRGVGKAKRGFGRAMKRKK